MGAPRIKAPKRQRIVGLDGQTLTRGRARMSLRKRLLTHHAPAIMTPSKVVAALRVVQYKTVDGDWSINRTFKRGYVRGGPIGYSCGVWGGRGASGGSGGGGGGATYPGTVTWSAGWAGATGSGTTAITDNSNFTSVEGSGSYLSVVAATGLGFPTGMTNVLKTNLAGATSLNHQIVKTDIAGAPAVSSYSFHRWFFRVATSGTQDFGDFHPIEIGVSPIHHSVNGFSPDPSNIDLHMYPGQTDGSLSYPYNATWYTDTSTHGAAANHTYCMELRFQRVTSTTVRMDMRISDVDGTGRTTSSSWHQDGNAWTGSPAMTIAANMWSELRLGNNDYERTGVGDFYMGGWCYGTSATSTHWLDVARLVGETW